MEFKAPRGTSDHLPELKSNWNKIEIIARETAKSFGYNEITTPVFEQTGLFKRAVGEGTDVVQKRCITSLILVEMNSHFKTRRNSSSM